MGLKKVGTKYRIDFRDQSGRRIIRVVGTSKREADAALAKIKTDIREGKFFDRGARDNNFTVKDVIDRYLKDEERRGRRSIETERTLLKPAQDYFPRTKVISLTERDVVRYREARQDAAHRNDAERVRKNATINREIEAFRRALNHAVRARVIPSSPAAGLKALEEPKGRIRFLSVPEAKNLLDVAGSPLRNAIMLALETGMRRGELFGLTWNDVDFQKRLIYISKTKNNHPRFVPMSGAAERILGEMDLNRGAGPYLFGGEKPIRDMRKAFATACRKAGIHGMHFHDLRHTFASWLVMAGVPLKTIGTYLGHRTSTITERYGHLSMGHLQTEIEKLPAWERKAGESIVGAESQTALHSPPA